ncbi:hypothetical protein [Facklamia sp. P9177]|uniref:hypothetical protein n=1 Tax=Facklamia sp. P9177 TaxID=3421945 RepID=UPI003D17E372
MTGKTVAELAKELNVTVQTIYKRLNKFKTIEKDSKGRKIITPAQEEEIKKELNPTTTVNKQEAAAIEALIEQLKQKDKTISELTNLLNNEQVLHQATQKRLNQLENNLIDTSENSLHSTNKENNNKKPHKTWWEKIKNTFKI